MRRWSRVITALPVSIKQRPRASSRHERRAPFGAEPLRRVREALDHRAAARARSRRHERQGRRVQGRERGASAFQDRRGPQGAVRALRLGRGRRGLPAVGARGALVHGGAKPGGRRPDARARGALLARRRRRHPARAAARAGGQAQGDGGERRGQPDGAGKRARGHARRADAGRVQAGAGQHPWRERPRPRGARAGLVQAQGRARRQQQRRPRGEHPRPRQLPHRADQDARARRDRQGRSERAPERAGGGRRERGGGRESVHPGRLEEGACR